MNYGKMLLPLIAVTLCLLLYTSCAASQPTDAPVPPTSTPTSTSVPPTATQTPVPLTAAPTATPIPPTATSTHTPTPVPPTPTGEKQPRTFDGLAYPGLMTLSGETIPVFFDTSRLEFLPTATAEFSADEFLNSVASEGAELKDLLVAVGVLSQQGFEIEGKPVDELISIIVYPQEGIASNEPIESPVTFSQGALGTLEEVFSRFGDSTEKELWSAEMTQAIGLDGLVYWWGEVGVAASEEGTITHVVVRQAPKNN